MYKKPLDGQPQIVPTQSDFLVIMDNSPVVIQFLKEDAGWRADGASQAAPAALRPLSVSPAPRRCCPSRG
jgi:hypothetical protein